GRRAEHHRAGGPGAAGRGALATVAEFHPSLVILDIMLPDIDGYGSCDWSPFPERPHRGFGPPPGSGGVPFAARYSPDGTLLYPPRWRGSCPGDRRRGATFRVELALATAE